MAKDKRLYARFDIGFDEHDKIFPLSDAAFRALVEATLYSRRQLTDGFLAERLAVKRWGQDVLDELSTNDSEKPSLVRVEDGWMIHDFAEHQTTNAEIESLREARREAGRRGGKASAQAKRKQVLEQAGSKTNPETETETETETYTPPSSSKDSEGGPPRTCKKHSTWDHDQPCRACGKDREAHAKWETETAAARRREARRRPEFCPHGFPRHEKCERCGDSWPG